jgi:predicted dehydrogenase
LFLSNSTTAAAAVALSARSYARVIGANERIGIGFIGAGIIGRQHFKACRQIEKEDNLAFLGVADCWKTRADEGAKTLDTRSLTDYRKLLDDKAVDYVVVATPEHQHCPMTLAALDAGKAVYCQKPLTHTIDEALQVADKQRATGLPLQVGVQGTADDSYRSAAKAIDEGLIGAVLQAQIEYVRDYQKAGPWRSPGEVAAHAGKPADLDWKAWLGPAPAIDWDPHHYFEWRNYSPYSGGIATDLFIHRITRIIVACKLGFPRRVVGMGGIWQWDDGRDLPDNFEMICEYPRGMTVYVLGTMGNKTRIDHLIRGSEGTLTFTGSGWETTDASGKVIGTHKKTGGEDMALHHTNFHNHLRSGEPLDCPVEVGVAGVAAVCMANESWRTGRMIGWDTEKKRMAPADGLELRGRAKGEG